MCVADVCPGGTCSFRYFPGTTEFDTQYKYSRRSLLYKAGYTSSQGVFWAGLWVSSHTRLLAGNTPAGTAQRRGSFSFRCLEVHLEVPRSYDIVLLWMLAG